MKMMFGILVKLLTPMGHGLLNNSKEAKSAESKIESRNVDEY